MSRSGDNQGFGLWYGLVGLWRSISPHETVKHDKESQIEIPGLHAKNLALGVDAIIAVVIWLGNWIATWVASGDMYYIILAHPFAVWKRILLWWLLFATWPGVVVASLYISNRHRKEIQNSYWEQFEAIDRLADKLVGGPQTTPQREPPVAYLEDLSDEDAWAFWERQFAE